MINWSSSSDHSFLILLFSQLLSIVMAGSAVYFTIIVRPLLWSLFCCSLVLLFFWLRFYRIVENSGFCH